MAEAIVQTTIIKCGGCDKTKEQPVTEKIIEMHLACLTVTPEDMEDHCNLGRWIVSRNRYLCGTCRQDGAVIPRDRVVTRRMLGYPVKPE